MFIFFTGPIMLMAAGVISQENLRSKIEAYRYSAFPPYFTESRMPFPFEAIAEGTENGCPSTPWFYRRVESTPYFAMVLATRVT